MLRLIIAAILLFLFDWYIFQAFSLVVADWQEWQQWVGNIVFWAVPAAVLGLLLVRVFGSASKSALRASSRLQPFVTMAYISKLIMAAVLVFDDFRRMILSAYQGVAGYQGFILDRGQFNAEIAILMGLLPFLILTYGILRNPYRYRVFKEKVPIADLPASLQGLRIVQISDIHSGSFTMREPVKEAIRLINEQKPDLVFFTGDMVNAVASEMIPFVDIFKEIKACYGVYSILGNHDYGDYHAWENQEAKSENFQNLLQTHRDMGWNLLLNENEILQINGEKIAVIGVENYSANARFHKYGNLSEAYAGTETAVLKLLLSHDPSHWDAEVITEYQDIAITFSGHTHGMQFGIEIPGWWRWSPIKYIYNKWAGLYQVGKQYLYVNRGLGFLGYPGRVGILPEITVIELEKA